MRQDTRIILLLLILLAGHGCGAFQHVIHNQPKIMVSSSSSSFSRKVVNPDWRRKSTEGDIVETKNYDNQDVSSSPSIEFENLIDMDVVIYSLEDNDDDQQRQLLLGAMQEDGVLSPLSAWTTEPAFGDCIEFLVDEVDRFALTKCMDKVRLHALLCESEMSYGSRQCHRGVGNPHGEESELLYYVEQDVIDKYQVKVIVKPELEILW